MFLCLIGVLLPTQQLSGHMEKGPRFKVSHPKDWRSLKLTSINTVRYALSRYIVQLIKLNVMFYESVIIIIIIDIVIIFIIIIIIIVIIIID